jgi:hypothetical protein
MMDPVGVVVMLLQSDGVDDGGRHKRAASAAGRSGPNTFRADPSRSLRKC